MLWAIYAQACFVPVIALAFGLTCVLSALFVRDIELTIGLVVVTVGLPIFFIACSVIAAAIMYRNSEFLITNRRVLIKVGLISRRTTEMFINKIESITVDQGIFGRLWDFGTVTIRGTGGSAQPFRMIAQPLEFRNHIQQIQSRTA
jgi:uncharacterized membrane protein YdbT with pleckstrin-like domain